MDDDVMSRNVSVIVRKKRKEASSEIYETAKQWCLLDKEQRKCGQAVIDLKK